MRWRVAVREIYEEDALRGVLQEYGGELVSMPNGEAFVWCSEFEQYDNPEDVWEHAKRLQERLVRFMKLDSVANFSLDLCYLCERNEDGTWFVHSFSESKAGPLWGIQSIPEWPLILDPTPEELEEYRRLLPARKRKAITLAAAALRNDRALQVMELLHIRHPSGTELGHIVDLIRDACNGDLSGLASSAQFTRLERSINHPDVMGLKARHAVTNVEPPPKPMSLSEATEFVHEVAQKWLEQISCLMRWMSASLRCGLDSDRCLIRWPVS